VSERDDGRATDVADRMADAAAGRVGRMRTALQPMRRAAPFVGIALLVAAVVYVVRANGFQEAFAAMRQASPLTALALAGSMLASVFLTGTVFWLLTSRFGRVPFVEMQALMASTTLANYLPLRPGLFGRVAYHKTRHGIRARDALRTVVEAIGLSVACLVVALPAVALGTRAGLRADVALALPLGVGLACCAIPAARIWALAWSLRYVETLLTAVRYHLAFQLIGVPVPVETSVAIACVSMAATLVPLVSNGIGLREWAIGLLAPILTGYALEQGIVAELVQRAFEIAVVIPTGLLGAAYLLKRGGVPTSGDDAAAA
jgi:hypothetical protein